MSNPLEEQLSALLDAELPAAELDMILARLEREPQRREKLARYSLIGECIRSGNALPSAMSVADRVRQQLDEEGRDQVIVTAPAAKARRWGRAAAMVAAAALLLAVLRLVPGTGDPGDAAVLLAETEQATTVADDSFMEVSTAARRRLEPRAAARLETYLMAHGEYAGVISRSSFDSRVVSARAGQASWQQVGDAGGAR